MATVKGVELVYDDPTVSRGEVIYAFSIEALRHKENVRFLAALFAEADRIAPTTPQARS